MKLWAVIPSRNRPAMLNALVPQLIADGVNVVLVDNGYDPPLDPSPGVVVIRNTEDPPNLSALWNEGLKYVADWEDGEYVVAVLNDDLRVPAGFVQALAKAILDHDAAGAYPDQHGWGQTYIHQFAGPISLFRRMTGYAFALRGSKGIFADETLRWWYGDDDIDWRCRINGGNVLVGGLKVEHLTPNETTTGVLAEQAGRDRQTFIEKWGRAPW